MARTLAAAGTIAVVLGSVAIGVAVTRKPTGGMSPQQSAATTRAVDQLDGDVKAVRAAVQEHATTLSRLLAVHAAIATDAATVADLVDRGDFAPTNGEILELGRIVKATGEVEELLLQPAGAIRMSHGGTPGSYADLVADRIVITVVVGVTPTEQAERYAGYLAVTRPLPIAPAIKALVAAGITGKLVLHGKEAAIGAMSAGATTREYALASQDDARIIAAEPPPHAVLPLPILVIGIAAAALGVVLLGLGLLGKHGPGDLPAGQASASWGIPPGPAGAPVAPGRPAPLANLPTVLSRAGIYSAETQLPVPSLDASGRAPAFDATVGTLLPGASSQIVAANLGAGAMIGRWEVVRRLGSGGMADVYLAQARGDGGFEKLVAIKVMHSHLARTQRAVGHFLDEARLAARIHHPNVVAIQDLGKIGDDYVIVMEYVDGLDLERLLTSARDGRRLVPLAVALGILCRICDGLDAAHRALSPDGTPLGIVHRDVKSANVLVSRQGIVKVVDFGIAKAAKQVHFTYAGETKGTPSMMAPEQRVGEQVDVRADVYSVAAVGYEIITGHAVNLDLVALAHLGIDSWPHLPAPSSLRVDAPRELDAILLHAMAFERHRRPADCAALGLALEAVMTAHQLVTSDKDIARWAESELRYLGPAYAGPIVALSKAPSR